MRRLALVSGGFVALAAVGATTFAGGGAHWRSLRLRAPARATPSLTAVVSNGLGSRLEQIDPATFSPVHASTRVTYYDGWARSPNGRLLAVSTNPDSSNGSSSTLRFATASSLRWQPRGVPLHGYFQAALWPRPGTLYVLAGDCCGPRLTLETIDVAARKVVSRKTIRGPLLQIAHSAGRLVLLEGPKANAVGPARLVVIGPDDRVRSLRLARIPAGSHIDQASQDPIFHIRQPGLALDAARGVAYVLDPQGLVAAVRLRDLDVTYHRVASTSLLARLSGWLTPVAQAKGANGPMLTAVWLGRGLIAFTGSNEHATRRKDGSFVATIRPAGLRIVDTRDWSSHALDPRTDSVLVADGVLLASGGGSHSDSSGSTSSGEGVAAYNPDGSLRWRIDPGAQVSLIAAYGDRALVQKFDTSSGQAAPVQLVDLATGHVVRRLPGDSYAWLLLGSGS